MSSLPSKNAFSRSRLSVLGRGFFKRPLPCLLHLIDLFHDQAILPLLSNLWAIEARLRGAVVGKGLFLGRPILKLHPFSKVVLADGFGLLSNQRRCSSGNLYAPCRIQTHSATSTVLIGEGVGLNGTSIVSRSRSIFIGKNSMLAPNCIIMDSPYHRLWPPNVRDFYPEWDLDQDIYIGSNCWIGTGCVILPGSHIGESAVIGARSIVSGEIPPNCLAVGSPAKVVRVFDGQKSDGL